MIRLATNDPLTISEIRDKQRRAFFALVEVRPPMAYLLDLVNEGAAATDAGEYGRRFCQLLDLFEGRLDGLSGSPCVVPRSRDIFRSRFCRGLNE